MCEEPIRPRCDWYIPLVETQICVLQRLPPEADDDRHSSVCGAFREYLDAPGRVPNH
jgi:hypothetical protein